MVVAAVAVLLVMVGAASVLLFRLARPLRPGQRVILVVVVVLAAAYFVPQIISQAIRGYRAGAEYRAR